MLQRSSPKGEKWLGYFLYDSSSTSCDWLLIQPTGQWSQDRLRQPQPPVLLSECSFSRVVSCGNPEASPMTKNGEPSRKGTTPANPRASSNTFHGAPVLREVLVYGLLGFGCGFQKMSARAPEKASRPTKAWLSPVDASRASTSNQSLPTGAIAIVSIGSRAEPPFSPGISDS